MYSKQQASQLRQEFWTNFGRYMQPVLSSEGERINWVNYKTGVKHVFFRMVASKGASIAIVMEHPDIENQKKCFHQFVQLRKLFENTMNETWNWENGVAGENGKIISRISRELKGVHVFNKADWPALISFFKPRLVALDEFWSLVKPGFETW
jgi:hypothetical protein